MHLGSGFDQNLLQGVYITLKAWGLGSFLHEALRKGFKGCGSGGQGFTKNGWLVFLRRLRRSAKAAKSNCEASESVPDRLPGVWVVIRITVIKGTLLGTPNREPQEYSRNIMEYKDPGRYIPWGSQ